MDNSDAQGCLNKAVTAFKLRDILTRFGMPEDETVTVYIKRNEQYLASCEIQQTSRKNYLETDKMSFRDFRTAITNDFLNPASVELDMYQHFPVAGELEECKIQVIFHGGKSGFKLELQPACCKTCNHASNYCCQWC